MVSFIMEYKWHLLISSEIVFWLTFCIFLLLRYWFHSRGQLFFLYISIVNQFLNIPLACLDFVHTGHVSLFQMVILGLYIYAIIRGPIDMVRLDHYIQLKVAKWKSNRSYTRSITVQYEFISNYPSVLRNKFYLHCGLFIIAQVILVIDIHFHTFWLIFLIIDGIWALSFHFAK